MTIPLIKARGLHVEYTIRSDGDMPWTPRKTLQALSNVDFHINKGETLGIVGESGCGKSTLARALIGLAPASGQLTWKGQTEMLELDKKSMRAFRANLQMIFQDPLAALNPRLKVGQIIAEPLKTHRKDLSRHDIRQRVKAAMETVGLLSNQINRYPHEFSGGQCQRIGIARALILEPELIICDEPVSALDVSIQAQVINLLMDLQQRLGLTLIFIAHDLSVVRHISTRVMVLYLGRVMEIANRNDIYKNPKHPYTQALINAVPVPDPSVQTNTLPMLLEGELPSPLSPPSGCVFRSRCPKAKALCADETPALQSQTEEESHAVACHFPD